jgi:hypothetical protein
MLAKRTKNHKAPDLSEKRRDTRYPLEVEAIVFCGGEFFTTQTLNISVGGLQLQTPAPERFYGKKVEIQIAADMDRPERYELHYGTLVNDKCDRLKFCPDRSI